MALMWVRHRLCRLLAAACLLTAASCAGGQADAWSSFVAWGKDAAQKAAAVTGKLAGEAGRQMDTVRHKVFGDACPIAKDVVGALSDGLGAHIRAQDRAVESIISSFESREIGDDTAKKPLVLAFTGPTGVGKVGYSLGK